MAIDSSQRWRMPVVWLVSVALWAGVVGAGVLLPSGDASAQGVAPVAVGSVGVVELSVGDAALTVDVADYFTGAVSSYGAVSGDVGVASVSVSGSVVSLSPVAAGATKVTVTATNTSGIAIQVFAVKVLPAGCVVSLGSLTVGSVISSGGSWADDGCLSVNVVGSRSYLYYAGYATFTVSEPVEVLFSLASTESNRLFLLEGSGTGGRVLGSASALTRTASASASLWKSLSPGAYTLEATTYYAAREASFSLTVDSMALNPPDSCVTSKGALAAGSTTTVSGSWARSEGCRSVNASTNRQHRHYADYVSFTVTDTVEARLTLASAIGKHLFLLDGAGAGGDVVGWPGTGYLTFPAVSWQKLAAGTYTIEAATFDTAVEGDYTLTIALAATKPTKGETLPDQEIPIGSDVAQINVSDAFSGTVDKYSVTSGNTSVVTASVNGSTVTLNGVAPGTATVTVTASNTAGSVSQSFTVTVNQLAAPQTVGALTAQTVAVGDTVTVDVTGAFTGTVDTYSAASDDTTVVTVSTTGSQVTLNGAAAGTATVTVTATNTAGSVEQSFDVTVTQAAPGVGVVLVDRSVSVGGVAVVDVASGFTGVVDGFVVSSDDAEVVSVSLDGSVVSLLGVGVGSASVVVEAVNGGGGVSQRFVVSVVASAAPGFGEAFSDRSLVVSELLEVPVTSGFTGVVDSFEAVSGDVGIVAVDVVGSVVVLRGVGVGVARVTVMAVNSGGRASRSFAVSVGALAKPTVGAVLADRSLNAGEIVDVDVASGFGGLVGEYRVVSSRPSLLGVSVEGSVLRLVGRAAGSVAVTVTAVNASGMVSQSFTVTLGAAEPLSVAVSASAYCLASEGVVVAGGGRDGVGSVEVSYSVSGGYRPYQVTVGDQNATDPAGAFEVSCAREGVDLATVAVDVNVVESGPKTVRVEVVDSAGVTESVEVEVTVAEDVYTTEYHDTTMRSGRSYVLGDGDDWTLITLPAGLNLRFTGLSENSRAHFTEVTTGAEIVLDWHTGQEVRSETPPSGQAHAMGAGGSRSLGLNHFANWIKELVASAKRQLRDVKNNAVTGRDWRPYSGLPDSAQVAAHPKMLKGETIIVCTPSLITRFHDQIKDGINAWHTKIRKKNPAYTRDIFKFNQTCPTDDDHHIQVLANTESYLGTNCNTTEPETIAGCAEIEVTGQNPPKIGGNKIYIKTTSTYHGGNSSDRDKHLRVMIHELGHFLGLGDRYRFEKQPGPPPNTIAVCDDPTESIMGGGDPNGRGCRSYNITDIDVDDLHAIYFPGALVGVSVVRLPGVVDGFEWSLDVGLGVRDRGGNYVANAFRYLVYVKKRGQAGLPEFVGGFWPVDQYFYPSSDNFMLPKLLEQAAGMEFWVVGVTGGDVRGSNVRGMRTYEIQELDLLDYRPGVEPWWLGSFVVTHGPPVVPTSLRADPRDGAVLLSWRRVDGASRYTVLVHDKHITDPVGPDRLPTSFTTTLSVAAESQGSVVTTRVEGLTNGDDYFFRVRSENEGLNYVSGLSTEVSASPAADSLVDEVRYRLVDDDCVGHGAGWVKVTAADGSYCAFEDSTAPDAKRNFKCEGAYAGYRLVPRVGQRPWCVKTVSVAAKTRMSEPFCETSGYEVSSDGLRCEKVVTLPLTVRVEYSCPAGYDLVTGFVAGAVTRHCSRTESLPATRSVRYTCASGFSRIVELGVVLCRKVESESATPVTAYRCSSGFDLKIEVLTGGLVTRRCVKTDTKTARAVRSYECASGYTKVASPLGNPYCQKIVTEAATRELSCSSGFTLVGSNCRRYTFTNPVNGRCPPGHTTVRVGFGVQCRKTTLVPATVTYSCAAGYTRSGTKCSKTFTRTVITRTGYVCDSGYVRAGRTCTKTTTRTPTTVRTYVCPSGYTRNGSQCTKTTTISATRVVEYDCGVGYTPVGTRCEKTDTQPVIATRTTSCPSNYKPVGSTCSRTFTEPVSRTQEPYCDSGDPPVTVTNDKDEIEHKCVTISTGAATQQPTTYKCPATPHDEPRYKLVTIYRPAATADCQRTLIKALTIIKQPYCVSPYKKIQTTDKNTTKYSCIRLKQAGSR